MLKLLRDAVAMVGLGLIGVGMWWISPAASLVVVGAILLGGTIWGLIRDP